MEKTEEIKGIIKDVILGWLMVWAAIIIVWIKFDWILALVLVLLVYGIFKLLNVSFFALVRELKNTNQK